MQASRTAGAAGICGLNLANSAAIVVYEIWRHDSFTCAASKDMHFKRMSAPGGRMPTHAELEILAVLWSRGPATVRDVHEHLKRGGEVGCTTVLKLLQNMLKKGLVLRQDEQRSHIYSAACKRADVMQRLTRGFIDRVFTGSRSELVLHALREERFSAEEIAEIQRPLDRIKQQER